MSMWCSWQVLILEWTSRWWVSFRACNWDLLDFLSCLVLPLMLRPLCRNITAFFLNANIFTLSENDWKIWHLVLTWFLLLSMVSQCPCVTAFYIRYVAVIAGAWTFTQRGGSFSRVYNLLLLLSYILISAFFILENVKLTPMSVKTYMDLKNKAGNKNPTLSSKGFLYECCC